MKQNKEFYDEIINAIREEIPEEIRDMMEVDIREIVKANDTVLHGVVIKAPEQTIVPTIYIEDCIKQLPEDFATKDLAEAIVSLYQVGMREAPAVESLSLEFDDIKDKLVVQLAEVERNRDRLKELAYKPLDNGMVMLAYVVGQEDERGSMRFAVTKDIVEGQNYDIDKMFETAMKNNEPVLVDISDAIFSDGIEFAENLFDKELSDKLPDGMYTLTNSATNLGATVLYYPDVQKRIGDMLQNSYYVLPSSIHELMILPCSVNDNPEFLRKMVKEANETVVNPQEVLSDRIFMYDREKERLVEPKTLERSGEERGER